MLIDKPGFYSSKAGKCEVVAVHGSYVFGRTPHGYPAVWHAGGVLYLYDGTRIDGLDITGPWEPRKPVEAWAVVCRAGNVRDLSVSKEASEQYRLAHWGLYARLIRLIEAPE